ncbi:MAG TPA: hypothetical protein VLF67_03660 [Candidatus Saccharimonas sp.]|nr:hypothetical protein [Candidatus Saccharimonas sp.]
MIRRAVLIVIVAALPLAAQADDSMSAQPNSLQSTGSSTASPQTGGLLQPASGNSNSAALQSADSSNGGVTQAANQQNLQQTGSSDQIKLLVQGEANAPQQLSDGPNLSWLWDILLVLLATAAGTGAALLLRRRST